MRTRQLKPGFFTSEQLAECQPLTRILFAALWCLADREGRLEDRPKRIKASALPYDNCDPSAMLEELQTHGLIVRYCVGDLRVISIPAFKRHQKPHPNEADSELPGITKAIRASNQGDKDVQPRCDVGDDAKNSHNETPEDGSTQTKEYQQVKNGDNDVSPRYEASTTKEDSTRACNKYKSLPSSSQLQLPDSDQQPPTGGIERDPVKDAQAAKKIVQEYQAGTLNRCSPHGGESAVRALLDANIPADDLFRAVRNYLAWAKASGRDHTPAARNFFASDGVWNEHRERSPPVIDPKPAPHRNGHSKPTQTPEERARRILS